jgi:hypothetical protein
MFILTVVFCSALNNWAETPRPAKPNVVLILVDDLGWQDVKCYDIDEPSPMETPNMDDLAIEKALECRRTILAMASALEDAGAQYPLSKNDTKTPLKPLVEHR